MYNIIIDLNDCCLHIPKKDDTLNLSKLICADNESTTKIDEATAKIKVQAPQRLKIKPFEKKFIEVCFDKKYKNSCKENTIY